MFVRDGVCRMRIRWLFGRWTTQRAPVIVAFLVLVSALMLRAVDPPEVARLREFAFDSFQRLKPRVPSADMPVRIVDEHGKVVYEGQSKGPYFHAKLPRGRYTVSTRWDAWSSSRPVTIGKSPQRLVFAWGAPPPPGVIA